MAQAFDFQVPLLQDPQRATDIPNYSTIDIEGPTPSGAATITTCPLDHPLNYSILPFKPRYLCDVCHKLLTPGQEAYSCRQCAFDLCIDCANKPIPDGRHVVMNLADFLTKEEIFKQIVTSAFANRDLSIVKEFLVGMLEENPEAWDEIEALLRFFGEYAVEETPRTEFMNSLNWARSENVWEIVCQAELLIALAFKFCAASRPGPNQTVSVTDSVASVVGYGESLEACEAILLAAAWGNVMQQTPNPIIWRQLIVCSIGLGRSRNVAFEQFNHGRQIAPFYFGLYDDMVTYLAPKLHGSIEGSDLFEFVEKESPTFFIALVLRASAHLEMFKSHCRVIPNLQAYLCRELVVRNMRWAFDKSRFDSFPASYLKSIRAEPVVSCVLFWSGFSRVLEIRDPNLQRGYMMAKHLNQAAFANGGKAMLCWCFSVIAGRAKERRTFEAALDEQYHGAMNAPPLTAASAAGQPIIVVNRVVRPRSNDCCCLL